MHIDGINIASCIENGFLGIDTTRFLRQKLPLQFDLHKINMYASLSRFTGTCPTRFRSLQSKFSNYLSKRGSRTRFESWQHAKNG